MGSIFVSMKKLLTSFEEWHEMGGEAPLLDIAISLDYF